MKAIIKFFKRDKVQITLIATFICAMAIGFVVSFVYIAFPKDPVEEERAEQRAERAKERAKYFKLKEMEEKNDE